MEITECKEKNYQGVSRLDVNTEVFDGSEEAADDAKALGLRVHEQIHFYKNYLFQIWLYAISDISLRSEIDFLLKIIFYHISFFIFVLWHIYLITLG